MTDREITHRSQIGPEYQRRYRERCEELGISLHQLPWDEFWKLSEWAKNEHRKFIEADKKVEAVEKQAEQRVTRAIKEGRQVIADADRKCKDCGKQLTKKPGRGRWPTRCPECRA